MRRVDYALQQKWAAELGMNERLIVNYCCVDEIGLDIFNEETVVLNDLEDIIGCNGITCQECWFKEHIKPMIKVYIVMNCGGSYEDSWEYADRAFFDEKKAEEYRDKQNEWLEKEKKRNESADDFDYYIYEQAPYHIEVIEVE